MGVAKATRPNKTENMCGFVLQQSDFQVINDRMLNLWNIQDQNRWNLNHVNIW